MAEREAQARLLPSMILEVKHGEGEEEYWLVSVCGVALNRISDTMELRDHDC